MIFLNKNPKYDKYERGLASIVYKFFDKKSALLSDKSASCSVIKSENMSNKKLAKDVQKPIFRRFKKIPFTDNI